MDSVTQTVLGGLHRKREIVTQGGVVAIEKIPEMLAAIAQCPVQDRESLAKHFAATLAASDGRLELLAIYQGILTVYFADATAYDTENHP